MTLNGAIMELVMLSEHPIMPVVFKPSIQKIIETVSECEEPERKTGKWILDRSGAYCCSKCMEPCATYVMLKPRDKFCKMCGARMEGTDERADFNQSESN